MMRIGAWLTLTGVSALLGACSGQTILANAAGGKGGAGEPTATQAGASGAHDVPVHIGGGPEAGGAPGGIGVAMGEAGKTPASEGGAGPEGGNGGNGTQPLAEVDSQKKADKLDVLFVIDNSPGMSEKQRLLGKSLDAFVGRLVNPRCVDAQGAPVAEQPPTGSAACSSGTREFTPVTDLHLGAISTSLGAHGGFVCSTPSSDADTLDDKAQLLPSMRGTAVSVEDSFIAFDASGQTGTTDTAELSARLSSVITAAGQHGCGFEAPLEAMYRFLVDPNPPKSVNSVKDANGGTVSAPQGPNDVLLRQRAAFLRPDSSLAIVILSDENDCSIMDTGVGWFVGSTQRMPRATVACDLDQNDPCCRSCAANDSSRPAGCGALKDDAHCGGVQAGALYAQWDMLHDSPNLRCFDQQRRFGFDLLNPLERYTAGLTNPQVVDWDGALVPNPLFAARDGKGPRSNSLISLSVIVGAPWQDLASPDSLDEEGLKFLSAAELEAENRFRMLIGAGTNGKPADPLMIESTDARQGTNPFVLNTGTLSPPDSTNPQANTINGHEQNIPNMDDLQYACIFPLSEPEECAANDPSCACTPDKAGNTTSVTVANSPVCQPPGGGAPGTTQYYGKAYPGLRQLRMARALGNRAAYGSVCPRQTSDRTRDSYGYVPALNALIDRIAVTLK